MIDLLNKLENIRKHNTIIRLNHEKKENQNKVNKLKKDLNIKILEYQEKNNKIINELNAKINELNIKNQELNQEKEYYKDIYVRLPKFIKKIYSRKKLKLSN